MVPWGSLGKGWRGVIAFSSLVVALTVIPFLYAYASAPKASRFAGLLSNPQDGNTYLAKMRYGARGEWLLRLSFTSEDHQGALAYPFYLLLGRLASMLSFPLVVVYHLARLLSGLFLLLAGYLFISHFLVGAGRVWLAFLLFSLASGWGWIAAPLGYMSPDLLVPESTTFHAIFATPHFPLATGLLLLTLWSALRVLRGGGLRADLLGGLMSVLLALVHPFLILTLWAVIILWAALCSLARRSLSRQEATSLAVILLSPLPVLGISYITLYLNPVLKVWMQQNVTPSPPPWGLLLGYGFLGLLALLGLIALARSPEGRLLHLEDRLLLLSWFGINLVLVYLPLSLQRRFLEGFQMPLSLLATLGVYAYLMPWARSSRAKGFLFAGILGVVLPTNLFLLLVSAQGAPQMGFPLYLSSGEREALRWLSENTAPTDTVLAGPLTGNLIPAWAGNRVFYGHPMETIYASEKLATLQRFFLGGMTEVERREFLAGYGIRYLYYGREERGMGSFEPERRSYLRSSFTQEGVAIYAVVP